MMVIDQYEIIGKIGEGGMGVIYKAVHPLLQHTVAIKALPSSLSSNAEIRERFIREATIQAKISHPNIVNIHNFLEFEGNYYLVMEYVEGETLEAMIKRLGLIPPDLCLSLFEQIAAGIRYAHGMGIIHRDIKPANLMVNESGTVKVMDFGIAKMDGGMDLTRAGVKVGTVWYMSPEQVKGQPATVATDVYSLGVTLFEMVTGRVPFQADSEYNVMKTIVETPPTSPRVFYPYIPEPMEAAILKAMAKNPAERFASVEAFARALTAQPARQESPRGETRSKPPVPAAVRFSSHQLVLFLGAVSIIACLVVAFALSPRDPSPTLAVSDPAAPKVDAVPPAPVKPQAPPIPEPVSRRDHEAREVQPPVSQLREPEPREQPRKETEAPAKAVQEKIRRYLALGARYHEDGNYREARAVYRKVLKLDHRNQAARTGIADANQAEIALSAR